MSTETLDATRWVCDNTPCKVSTITADDKLPVGWFEVTADNDSDPLADVCSVECLAQWADRLDVREQDVACQNVGTIAMFRKRIPQEGASKP